MALSPLVLANAAALTDGPGAAVGEVRHVGVTDALDSNTLSNPTRQLANRDNIIAAAVNDLITVVNNQEQYINIPAIQTSLPSTTSEVVTNFRIPPGFEARVLNAIVSSTPPGQARLEIDWDDGYGGSTGQAVVSTATEFSGGTTFWSTGEFIATLFNDGASSSQITASIILTMRPVGPQAGGIIGPGAVGPQGKKGDTGAAGTDGGIGPVGPAGTPGLIWMGTWQGSNTYYPGDVISYNTGGWGYSSYVAVAINSGQPPPTPPTPSDNNWNVLASASLGATGAQGIQGIQGIPGAGLNWSGNWSSSVSYAPYDIVRYTADGSTYASFIALGSNVNFQPPNYIAGSNTNLAWDLMVEGGVGQQGVPGIPGVNPVSVPWNTTSTYNQRDLVTVNNGSNAYYTYYATSAVGSNVYPLSGSGPWIQFFGPAASSNFSSSLIVGELNQLSPYYTGSSPLAPYTPLPFVAGQAGVPLTQLLSAASPGAAFLHGYYHTYFAGSISVALPTASNGAQTSTYHPSGVWTSATTNINVIPASKTGVLPLVSKDGDSFHVFVAGSVPQDVQIQIFGMATY